MITPAKDPTQPVRVPSEIHAQVTRMAALRSCAAGDLLAEAWAEYLERHREQFAHDLEQAAKIMRDGTAEELAAFASRNAPSRAAAAAARLSR